MDAYPMFIRPAAEAVVSGEAERAIVLGGSGNGEAIVANRCTRRALCVVLERGHRPARASAQRRELHLDWRTHGRSRYGVGDRARVAGDAVRGRTACGTHRGDRCLRRPARIGTPNQGEQSISIPCTIKKKASPYNPKLSAKFSPSLDKNIHPIDIGIDEKNRKAVVDLLQVVLANLNVIYVRTRNYHWNITGPRFHTLHLFLEEQYKELGEAADEVAERIRTLGAFLPRNDGGIH